MAGVKTQKTKLYWRRLNGATYSIVPVLEGTQLTTAPGSPQKIDTTSLDSDAVESLAGLTDNGTLQFQLNLLPWDDGDADDQTLFLAQANGDVSKYIIGLSDGTAPPTVDSGSGVVTYPTTRSWRHFDGSFVGATETYNGRDAVRISAPIEITGAITKVARSTS